MKLCVVSAAILAAALTACTPPAVQTDGAAAAPAPSTPAADIAAAAAAAEPTTPNTAGSLASVPAADAAAPAPDQTPAQPPTTSAPQPAAPAAEATPAEIENGRAAYTRTCAMCHGSKGEGTPAGSPIATRDVAAIANKITEGIINPGERMPAMGGMLSAEEIDDVSKFVAAGMPQ